MKSKASSDSEEGENFFEEEAELSGSDEEADENDDGDSGEDDSIVYSGDESELPGTEQLKEQLGRIYRKDQMDEDQRQIRMFKEMYLGGKEKEGGDSRRKQFRWKNADNNLNDYNQTSSEEDDDADDCETNEDSNGRSESGQVKNEKYLKLMETRNWRMIRHEREQFVKLKAVS